MAGKPDFAHLHVHTEYSLLDGACRIDKLVDRVKELGMDSIAVTDHGVMTGLYKLQAAANKAGVKPIFGCELYFTEERAVKDPKNRYYHLTALAETTEGLHNLYKMNLRAAQEGMYYGKPRVDYELLKEYGQGVIILSGCLAGRVMQSLANADLEADPKKRMHAARDELLRLTDCVGKDNVYVEVQNSGVSDWDGNQFEWNGQLKTLADDLGLITVGTSDTHYLTADERRGPRVGDPWYHDTLLCVQTRSLKDQPLGERMSLVHDWQNPHYYHLRSVAEMRKTLENVPESIENTLIVAERCNAEIRTGRTFEMLPDFPVPEDYTPPAGKPDGMEEKMWTQQSFLREKIWEGLHRRYGAPLPAEVVERAEYELEVINKMGTTSYFLITWDWIRYAKEIGMVIGPGRGCFTPDTPIWTPEGYRPISEIGAGDTVLDENGDLAAIRKRFEYQADEELVHIRSYYGDSAGLTVTPDHKILVEKGVQNDRYTRRVKSRPSLGRWAEPTGELQWIPAREVEPGDLVAVAVPKLGYEATPRWDLADFLPENDRRRGYLEVTDTEIVRRVPCNRPYRASVRDLAQRYGLCRPSIGRALSGEAGPRFMSKLQHALNEEGFLDLAAWTEHLHSAGTVETRIPRYIQAENDFCRLLGLIVSDGWIRAERSCTGIAERRSQPHSEPSVTELWASVWGSDQLGQYPHAKTDLMQYESGHPVIAEFYRHLLEDYQYGADTKYLPDWTLRLPEPQRRALLEGLWMGDGSTVDRHKYSTSSPRLAHGVRTLLWTLGIPSSLAKDERTDHRAEYANRKPAYSIVASRGFNEPKRQFGARIGDYMLMRVTQAERVQYKGPVYDLAVEDPNPPSYTTSSCIVHNSGAGSIVLYALDVTQLCPLEHKLLFERFLSPERISMPDVDTDAAPVGDADYDKVRQYLRDKYGEENCAQIITFQTIGGKAGIRSAARAFGPELLPLADRLAKAVPMNGQVPVPLPQALEEGVELKQAITGGGAEAQKIIDNALWMEGLISAESVHAAAFVISPIPLTDALPVQLNKDGNPVTAFAMSEAESVGCLKLDLLGLRNLSILADAQRLIKKYHGVEVDAVNYQVPMDDEKTFKMLARGESVGVFQFESGGMADTLRAIGTTEFNDLVAIVAAYRPGAMDQIPLYARRKKGLEPVTYGDERMREILHETYGLCLTGDAILIDAVTGARHRLDDVVHQRISMVLQGLDEQGRPRLSPITDWFDNGEKDVFEVRLANGSTLKMTKEHRVYTEDGWCELGDLEEGAFIACPRSLIKEEPRLSAYTSDQLLVLGYLIGDGGLTSGSSVEFYSSERAMIDAFAASCKKAFPDLRLNRYDRPRGVTMLACVRSDRRDGKGYHSPSTLLQWLRDLGLKHDRGGCSSAEKFIPSEMFELPNEELAQLIAAMWDCDGHVSRGVTHYRTISRRLAEDMRTALLMLGISNAIYESSYEGNQGDPIPAFQVSVKDGPLFTQLVQPHMAHPAKRSVDCEHVGGSSVDYQSYVDELKYARVDAGLSLAKLEGLSGTKVKNHLYIPRKGSRISGSSVAPVVGVLDMPQTKARLAVDWSEIKRITPAGRQHVYDLTVDSIHSYVANGVYVHNCLYQEQAMLLSRDLAGFTGGLMDTLRKAIGKKLMDKMMELKPIFFHGTTIEKDGETIEVPGCLKNGVDKKTAEWVWSVFEASASYSFNKSHAAAYALISYVTAYLKANYPVEYMAALLTSVMHTKDKVPFYLYETKRMGIQVLPPSVNESFSQFEPSGENAIRFGLTAVKGVGEGIVEQVVTEREANGPFRSLWDFVQRVEGVNRRELDHLIKAGALDFTGEARKGMLEVTDQALKQAKKTRVKKAQGQDSLFEGLGGSAEDELAAMLADTAPAIPKEEFDTMERFRQEREVTGLYVSGHPLDSARAAWERVRHLGVGEINEEHLAEPGDSPPSVTVAGIITNKRAVYTKRDNKRMLIIQLEDLTGTAEIVVFPKLVEQGAEEYLSEGDLAYLRVSLEEDTRGFGSDDDDGARQVKLIAQHAGAFNPEAIEVSEYYDVSLPADIVNAEVMQTVMHTLERYPGEQAVRLMLLDDAGDEVARHLFPEHVRVKRCEELTKALKAAVGA